MSGLADAAGIALIVVGLLFFTAGTIVLLRFPDVHSRLHALTKADNLGLGLVTFGLMLGADDLWLVLKMLLTWVLAVLAAATVSQLIARAALAGPPPRDPRTGP